MVLGRRWRTHRQRWPAVKDRNEQRVCVCVELVIQEVLKEGRKQVPYPKMSALLRTRPAKQRPMSSLLKTQIDLTKDFRLVVKCTRWGSAVKWPGVVGTILSLDLVLGLGVFPTSKIRPWI